MQYETSRHKPLIHRETGHVLAWRVRITVHVGDASGYDDITFPTRPTDRPPAQWTRAQVDACVAEIIGKPGATMVPSSSPGYAAWRAYMALVMVVEERARTGIDESFAFTE